MYHISDIVACLRKVRQVYTNLQKVLTVIVDLINNCFRKFIDFVRYLEINLTYHVHVC